MRKAGNLKSENSQDYAQNRNLNEIVCSWIRLLVDSSGVVPFREMENSSSTEMKLETAFIEQISSSCVHVRYRNTEFFARTLLSYPEYSEHSTLDVDSIQQDEFSQHLR